MPPKITSGLLKTDAIARGLDDEIYRRINLAGLTIFKRKRVRLTIEEVDLLYSQHIKRIFYPNFAKYMIKNDSEAFLATILAGRNAIALLRSLVGNMYPNSARKGTIRRDLAIENFFQDCPMAIQNLIDAAWDESKVILLATMFFPEELNHIIELLYSR